MEMWRLVLIICSIIAPYYAGNCVFSKFELPESQVYPMVDLSNRLIQHLHEGSFTFDWGKRKAWKPVVQLMNGNSGDENTDTFNVSLTRKMILLGNRFRTLEKDALKGLPMLVSLDLSYCKIEQLERGCFRHIIDLTELNLEGNDISNFDDEVFNYLSGLRSLVLSRNRLNNVTVRELRMLESLDLSYNEITDLNVQQVYTLESLAYLNLKHNNFASIPLISGWKLQFLDISSNPIRDLGNLGNFLKLHVLVCRNHKLQSLSQDVFYSKTNMDIVDMMHGTLQHIDHYAFIHCERLRILNLANNDLNSTMPWISWTVSVQKMYLSGNPLKTSFIEAFGIGPDVIIDVASQTVSLSLLWLNNIGLEHLPKFSELLGELKYLQLRDNRIRSIEPFCFLNLVKLTELDLSNNRIGDINLPDIFDHPTLRSLKLSGNMITTLIFINPLKYLDLDHLDVSNNRIRTVILHDTPENHITFLNISDNRLRFWDAYFLIDGIQHLEKLDISHNEFTSLDTKVFANLNIKTLIASHNLITGINCTSIPDVFNTTVKLDLSHNLISEWPPCMNLLPSCQELLIGYNEQLGFPWRLVTSGQLKTLDLSGNGLEAIPQKPVSNSSSIHNLILRQNAISIIPDNLCHFMKDLRTIDLRENHISLIELSKLEKCEKLEDFKVSKNMVDRLEYSMMEVCNHSSCSSEVHKFSFTGPELGTLRLTTERKEVSQSYLIAPKCER